MNETNQFRRFAATLISEGIMEVARLRRAAGVRREPIEMADEELDAFRAWVEQEGDGSDVHLSFDDVARLLGFDDPDALRFPLLSRLDQPGWIETTAALLGHDYLPGPSRASSPTDGRGRSPSSFNSALLERAGIPGIDAPGSLRSLVRRFTQRQTIVRLDPIHQNPEDVRAGPVRELADMTDEETRALLVRHGVGVEPCTLWL